MLVFLDNIKYFYVKVNSSDFKIGAILSQQLKADGKWYSVVFFNKFLSLVEQNYEIYDKKILVVIHVLEE